jgi:protein TonB
MPSFPGGNAKFYEFIAKNLKYPRRALKANVEGKVVVRFIVAEDGDVSDVEVLKGIGYDCDEEAIRVLNTSPNWIPGKQRGRNVKVRVMVPLTFDI